MNQNQYKSNYNTDGRPVTRGFQSNGETPWNTKRSARDWLDSPSPQTPAEQTQPAAEPQRSPQKAAEPPKPPEQRRRNQPQFKMPKIKLPRLQLKLPRPAKPAAKTQRPAEKPPTRPPGVRRPSGTGTPRPTEAPARQPRKPKQPRVITAAISGLIVAAIVLLAEVGLWGSYCYSHTLPGDTNVKASTFMYCFALFAGNFWAGAVVRRRSLKPGLIICGVFLALSLIISLNLFSWREIKIKMFLLKIVLTAAAAAAGFILSLVPYLINKAIKKERQEQAQRRQRQLERRQLQQQQQELEREIARRTRGRF